MREHVSGSVGEKEDQKGKGGNIDNGMGLALICGRPEDRTNPRRYHDPATPLREREQIDITFLL
jgi:hypothetical protein